jgi:ABC-type nitrate/sulfonate/bicarbonate transport system substrate-binding protein
MFVWTRASKRTRPMTRRPLAAVAAMGAVAALALTACGGSGNAAPKADGAPTELRVIESNKQDPTEIGAEAGNYLNIWSKCSPEVKVTLTAGEKVAEAVAAKSADIGIASPNRVIGAVSQGLKATIIGSSMPVWDQYVVVRSDSGINSIADLKGSTFAISSFGSAGDYATQKIAREEGWGPTDFKTVTMGSLDGIMAGLKSGTADAFLWSAQAAFGLEIEGSAKVLGSVKDLVGPNAMTVVFASDEIIQKNPAAVKSFAECYYKATEAIMDDETLANKMLVESWGMSPELAAKIIKDEIPMSSRDGELSEEQLAGLLEATQFTIKSAKALTLDDVKGMYKYWKSL